jgi:hypothetical protein
MPRILLLLACLSGLPALEAPAGLRADYPEATHVWVQWQTPLPASGMILVNDQPRMHLAADAEEGLLIGGLRPGTENVLTLRCTDATGTSSDSNRTVTTPALPGTVLVQWQCESMRGQEHLPVAWSVAGLQASPITRSSILHAGAEAPEQAFSIDGISASDLEATMVAEQYVAWRLDPGVGSVALQAITIAVDAGDGIELALFHSGAGFDMDACLWTEVLRSDIPQTYTIPLTEPIDITESVEFRLYCWGGEQWHIRPQGETAPEVPEVALYGQAH